MMMMMMTIPSSSCDIGFRLFLSIYEHIISVHVCFSNSRSFSMLHITDYIYVCNNTCRLARLERCSFKLVVCNVENSFLKQHILVYSFHKIRDSFPTLPVSLTQQYNIKCDTRQPTCKLYSLKTYNVSIKWCVVRYIPLILYRGSV